MAQTSEPKIGWFENKVGQAYQLFIFHPFESTIFYIINFLFIYWPLANSLRTPPLNPDYEPTENPLTFIIKFLLIFILIGGLWVVYNRKNIQKAFSKRPGHLDILLAGLPDADELVKGKKLFSTDDLHAFGIGFLRWSSVFFVNGLYLVIILDILIFGLWLIRLFY